MVKINDIISAMFCKHIFVWVIRTIVFCALVSGFLLSTSTSAFSADDESDQPLNCISCHDKTLSYHDKFGSGTEACWTCHDNIEMASLRLGNGYKLPLSESSQLCGQCHQKRYNAWKEGTHGVPGTVATVKCTECHDPHQPQIALLGITKPHPASSLTISHPPYNLVMVAIITFVLFLGLVIVGITRGRSI